MSLSQTVRPPFSAAPEDILGRIERLLSSWVPEEISP
jgi:hypothetical protein